MFLRIVREDVLSPTETLKLPLTASNKQFSLVPLYILGGDFGCETLGMLQYMAPKAAIPNEKVLVLSSTICPPLFPIAINKKVKMISRCLK